MKKLKDYEINFAGLELGTHSFNFEIDNDFFSLFVFDKDFGQSKLISKLQLEKKHDLLVLDIHIFGEVELICDVSCEEYWDKLDTNSKIIVKFGEEFNDVDDNIVFIPTTEFKIDVSQFIYEIILIALPQKRIHPDIKSGKMKSDIIDILNGLKPKVEIPNEEKNDPRWDILKTILTDKK